MENIEEVIVKQESLNIKINKENFLKKDTVGLYTKSVVAMYFFILLLCLLYGLNCFMNLQFSFEGNMYIIPCLAGITASLYFDTTFKLKKENYKIDIPNLCIAAVLIIIFVVETIFSIISWFN